MTKLADGSTVSSYFDVGDLPTGKDIYQQGASFTLGQIDKVHFIDDQSNMSKKFVEYDVSARDEKGGQSTFRNVRYMALLGGSNDFEETIMEPSEHATTGKLDASNFASNKNGTMVLLAFIHGSKDKPFIVGAIPHPKKDGAKRADGIRKKGEFRGIQWEVNKDGEFTLTYNGNRLPNGKLARTDSGPTKIKIDKAGVFTIIDNKGQKFEINRTVKTISFSNGTTVIFDGENDKVTVKTTAGANVVIDGKNNAVTLKDNGSGEIKISGDKIAIGASSAELLQQISDALQKLITWANTVGAVHDHIGNLGYPTSPPEQASDYTQLGSDLSTIKGKVDGIKGTL